LKAIRQDVMIFSALLRHDGFDRRSQSAAIAGCARADNGKEKVASCHRALNPKMAIQYGQIS